MKTITLHLAIASGALLLWVFAGSEFHPIFFPSPLAIAQALVGLLSTKTFWVDVLFSLGLMFVGLLSAILLGVFPALLLWQKSSVMSAVTRWVDHIRSIPAPALLPIFLLVLGVGAVSKVALTALVCFCVLFLQTSYGVTRVNATRVNAFILMNASLQTIIWRCIFFEALPYISSATRLCISLSFVITIVAEMLSGGPHGLGRSILDYQLVYDTPHMYAVILLTGCIGYAMNHLYTFMESRALHWVGK